MKLYKFFHFCAKQKRMCNSLVSFFNLREAALSIIFYHKIINFRVSGFSWLVSFLLSV